MPTLMANRTFDELAKIRNTLNAGPLATGPKGRLAGIFVPWAGSRLRDGGIYYVGMATDGEYWADDPQSLDLRLERTASLCNGRHDRARSPFWQFLDGLTWALLGAPFNECSDWWGWSNLLKIGWSVGSPNEWRPPVTPKLLEDQRGICIDALREEFAALRNTLIVIASSNTFNVLDSPENFPKLIFGWKDNYEANWKKHAHEQTGVWWFPDPNTGNLYVHCYHPGYAVRAWDSCWGSALGRIIHVARAMPLFTSSRAVSVLRG